MKKKKKLKLFEVKPLEINRNKHREKTFKEFGEMNEIRSSVPLDVCNLKKINSEFKFIVYFDSKFIIKRYEHFISINKLPRSMHTQGRLECPTAGNLEYTQTEQ